MPGALALIDCNNFFVSCERLFRPELVNRPVVVLSSNDGCVVSRSNEAKALGIPMGAPAFKYKDVFRRGGVVQFSANFDLYGDISQRITKALMRLTPRIEVYSVDESFLDLSELNINNYKTWAEAVRYCIFKDIGLPVAIGVAPSKTLAKIATERAKQDPENHDTLDLYSLSPEKRQNYLIKTPIKDVWGVGWRLAPKLRSLGIKNAEDLKGLRPAYARQLMGIQGQRMVAELNGQRCYNLEPLNRERQSVMHGRMFGQDTNSFEVVEAAVTSLTAKAARQLREEGLLAKKATIHLSTNRHKLGYKRISQTIRLSTPSADSSLLASEIVKSVRSEFDNSNWFHRANIIFYDLVSNHNLQTDLTGQVNLSKMASSKALFEAFDSLNTRYGGSTIYLAAEGLSKSWQPKKALKSPRYTTDWQDIPILEV